MGRLTFITTMAIELTPNVKNVSIVNTPEGLLKQCYIDDSIIHVKTANIDIGRHYAWAQFGDATQLPLKDVSAASIKSFPQYGTYAAVSYKGNDGLLTSTILKGF